MANHISTFDTSVIPSYTETLRGGAAPPEDVSNKVLKVFFIWGVGVLLPWNAILSVFDYLSYEMPGFEPTFIYPFAVNCFLALSQIYMILQGHKFSTRMKI